VITSELNRISSHLVWFGAFLLDLGGFTPLLYAFDDREKILDLLEGLTGARLTYCYYRFGGLYNDVDDEFLDGDARLRGLYAAAAELVSRAGDRQHHPAQAAGRYRPHRCQPLPQIRGDRAGDSRCGRPYDVRRAEPYSVYPELDFEVVVFPEKDCMARYMVRMDEIEQSLNIIEQALDLLPEGPIQAKVPRVIKLPPGDYCYAVEAARGRFMVRIVSDGKRSALPGQAAHPVVCEPQPLRGGERGMMLPDALAVMGSLDLVIPDIDR
jgi:NADH-quinone oxidoreductase subunit D